MECTKRSLITRVSTFYPASSDHGCLTVCHWNLSKSPAFGTKAFDCVWNSDRCRPHSVTFGYYKFIKLLIATYIYFFSPVPDSPRSISINVQNDSHILLQWQPPEHVNGAITGYQVIAQKQPELMTAITWRTNDSSTEILMDHIDFQAVYRISVLAINRMGKGPPVTVTFDLSAGWFLLWWDIILRAILGIQRAKALAFLAFKDWQWYNSTWEINLCPK